MELDLGARISNGNLENRMPRHGVISSVSLALKEGRVKTRETSFLGLLVSDFIPRGNLPSHKAGPRATFKGSLQGLLTSLRA